MRRANDREAEAVVTDVGPIPLTWLSSLCLDFVNSTFADHTGGGRVFDRLPKRQWWDWLASRWELRLPPKLEAADLRKLERFRGELRAVLDRARRGHWPNERGVGWINRSLGRAPYRFAVGVEPHGWRLRRRPQALSWDGVIAEILLSLSDLLATGTRRRIRRCGNPSCTWIFYDDSRNRTRRWCDPRHCGNLIKVRRHRARLRPAR